MPRHLTTLICTAALLVATGCTVAIPGTAAPAPDTAAPAPDAGAAVAPSVAGAPAQQWAGAAFLDSQDRRPTVRTGRPQTITTATGRSAVIVKATATAASPLGLCSRTGVAYAVSATGFTGKLGPTAILIVVAGTGFPAAVPDDQIRQVLTTLRPES